MKIHKVICEKDIIKILIGAELSDDNLPKGNMELDIENQSQFVEEINDLFVEEHIRVILDMRYINYIDSSGLWALFEGYKTASQKKGKLVLLNPTQDVKRVLDITKMSSKIQIFESEEEALEALQ